MYMLGRGCFGVELGGTLMLGEKMIYFFREGDWRISFGLVVSVVWLAGVPSS